MIESMRAYGYTPETAIADLIDNSITAKSKNIWLNFHWNGSNSYISILDDGIGMNENELRNAMKPGSQNPIMEREPQDLGRFGLGLKTASFSQCRQLTVTSKRTGGDRCIRCWNLDHVEEVNLWELLKSVDPASERIISILDRREHGTIICLEKLDRIVGDSVASDEPAHRRFDILVEKVQKHLAMVFHRYLDQSNRRLRIFLNGEDEDHSVKAWDPFMINNTATVQSPKERIRCHDGMIEIQGFVLPHRDMLNQEEFDDGAGPNGWTAQQGFYVYRNERMIVPGSWLNLGRDKTWTREEHYRLARLRLDLPNSMDMDWQIDIKKSTARPPASVRSRLIDLAENIRSQARYVFVHRGSYGPRPPESKMERIWKTAQRSGRTIYKIDRKHPMVLDMIQAAPTARDRLDTLMAIIEETVPVEKIWLDTAEGNANHPRPFQDIPEENVRRTILETYRALRRQCRISPGEARNRLCLMDAFIDLREYIRTMEFAEEDD